MSHFKKHITAFFLFVLLLPTAIQSLHAFEEHEHVICTSNIEQHLHELENDCGDLHLQLKVFYYNFNNYDALYDNKAYTKNPIAKPQQLISNNSSYKSSRGPPFVII